MTVALIRKCIGILNKMIEQRSVERVPGSGQMRAIGAAVTAMHQCYEQFDWPILKWYTVLAYHLGKPEAIVFKDVNTMNALKVGVQAMEYIIGERYAYEPVEEEWV